MRILFVGDIFAEPGMRTLEAALPEARSRMRADLVVANGENAARGYGITPGLARRMFAAGVDVVTTGNHVWDRWEIAEALDKEARILRPANLAPGLPGRGWCVAEAAGRRVAVVNLVGRIFMEPADCPFRTADAVLEEVGSSAEAILLDFHAEATSEKLAMGYHLDGRVTAVIGTHTHVPTADARVLPGGTGYLTDVGMTGVQDSVIGTVKEKSVKRFITGVFGGMPPAEGRGVMMAALLETGPGGRCVSIHRVEVPAVV